MRRPTRTQTSRFRQLIARLEPTLQRAFLSAIADVHGNLDWQGLNQAIAAGNIDAAVSAIRIDQGAFLALWQAADAAYIAGATETVATLGISGVPASAGIRFDMTNPRAEAYLATASSRMVAEITEDSKQAVREAIQRGYTAGRGPRDIATDVAGRVVGGRRTGGIVGLDTGRAYRLDMVQQGMKTADGVQDLVIRHQDGTLGLRYKVNKATEKRILAAYRAGTAVSAQGQRMSVDQFRNALLKSRADTIAQLETSQAVMAGRREEWGQVLEKLGRSEADVEKRWQHGSGGTDPRPHHVAMNNKTVRGLDMPFVFNNGSLLRYAHDENAPISETARCTCDTTFRLLPDLAALR